VAVSAGVIRRLLARLLGRSDSDEADEEGRFVPSRLDASVRDAHGGAEAEVARELDEVSERARELDEGRRGG